MSFSMRVFRVLLLFPVAMGWAGAQQTQAGPIHLSVAVTSRPGSPVAGLTQADFVVLEDKVPFPVTGFKPMRDAGGVADTKAILVIDAVNMGLSSVASTRQQVDKFLLANGGALAMPTQLAILQDNGLETQQTFTRDGRDLAAGLDKADIGLRTIRRSTGIYGADDRLGISLNAMRGLLTREAEQPGRKVILFVSPGWPILSGPGIQLSSKQETQIYNDVISFSALIRRADAVVYSIDPIGAAENLNREDYYQAFQKGLASPRDAELGDLSLQVLALHSGGLVLNSNNDLGALLRQAVADAGSMYEISFNPPPADHPGAYRHLEVEVKRPGVKARTTDGYYDHP